MKQINLISFCFMIILMLSFIFSCQQKNASTSNQKHEVDPLTVIYYVLPVNSELNLIYYDDFCRPVPILLLGTGEKDSININIQGYTFLENQHSIYEVWSLLLKPGDTLLLEDIGAPDKSYNTFKIKSLNSEQRTIDLNYHTAYNNWRKSNKQHHSFLNSKLSFWSKNKNPDSILFYLDQFYNERLAFAIQYQNKNKMTEDSYAILKNDFFAATTKSKFRALNKYFSKEDPRTNQHLQSLTQVYSEFFNRLPEQRLNAHVLSTANLLIRDAIDPKLKDQEGRMAAYIKGINKTYKGKGKSLLLLDFLIQYKNIENYKKLKDEFKDTSMISYLDNAYEQYQLTKKFADNKTYALDNKSKVISIDSLLTDHKGKKTILNFWASWCAPCLKELNELLPSIKEYDPNEYQFVFLSVDNSNESWLGAQKSLNMVNLSLSFILSDNVNSNILSKFSIKGFPTTLFFNSRGEMQLKEDKIITPKRLNQILIGLK